jgi:hypothetical protein
VSLYVHSCSRCRSDRPRIGSSRSGKGKFKNWKGKERSERRNWRAVLPAGSRVATIRHIQPKHSRGLVRALCDEWAPCCLSKVSTQSGHCEATGISLPVCDETASEAAIFATSTTPIWHPSRLHTPHQPHPSRACACSQFFRASIAQNITNLRRITSRSCCLRPFRPLVIPPPHPSNPATSKPPAIQHNSAP